MTWAKGHALVIAVANYEKVSVLPEAVLNDARDIASVLSSPNYCGFDPNRVQLLLDKGATLSAIRTSFSDLAKVAQPDDAVVIFFSGHGVLLKSVGAADSALVPVDCDISALETTTLSAQEFTGALSLVKSERILVLLDACHSGGAASFKTGSDSGAVTFAFNEKSLSSLSEGIGRVAIASCRSSETSLVLGGARNSVFTDALLGALRGKARTHGDGVIRVFEVFNYVAETVRRTVPGQQHPIFKASDVEDNFPVALLKGGKGISAQPSIDQTPNQPDYWAKLEAIFSDLYPTGPAEESIWLRAGGDLSRLTLSGTGRAQWFAALRTLRHGGGGSSIRPRTLVETGMSDFPHHPDLLAMLD
jgi:hypothetical protein